ncbi:MAG: VCBS repeat-containing protein [Bacteroidota bacterium]
MYSCARYILSLLIIILLLSCRRDEKQFTLLSHKRTGIEFRNPIKEFPDFNSLDYNYMFNGAGVAAGDINNDKLVDLFFTGNFVGNRLYLNKGNFRFEDITEKAGISAAESWSNGVVMADVNGDGFLDIYVANSTDRRQRFRKNFLFLNNGDLTFTEQAEAYGIADNAYTTHSTFLDYDKDGDLDLFVLNHSVDKFAMFSEDFIPFRYGRAPWYGQKLFRNDGNRFTEVTRTAGFFSGALNFGLGVAVADFNGDHWPDLYVCNDYYEKDYFYINQKDGTFRESMEEYFRYISLSSMGCDAADINNDGTIDLFTLDMLPEDHYEQKLVEGPDNYEKLSFREKVGFYYQTTRNMMQLNSGGTHFTEIGQYAGPYGTNWSWSPLLCDFDHDGFKDLFITNGYGKNVTHMDILHMSVEETIKRRAGEPTMDLMDFLAMIPATVLRNYMFKNQGDLTFSNEGEAWGFTHSTLSNGATYADLDNDGDMDLVISNVNEYAHVYRNNTERLHSNHYLKVLLEGSGMNSGGIGARIDVFCGERVFTQEASPSRGYMSSVDHALIFGLGDAPRVDSLIITWPDLRSQTLSNIEADRSITLRNEDAIFQEEPPPPDPQTLFVSLQDRDPLHFLHRENAYNDFKTQILLPWKLSTQGPRMSTGDINGDGLDDLFVGGARGFPGKLFQQTEEDSFEPLEMSCFEADTGSEDVGVLFVDVDGDRDQDLYVVSGGNEFSGRSAELQDRLYLNDGSGHFVRTERRLPSMLTSGSCVEAADMDGDGDQDLFVGGRLTPGGYPLTPRSYLLENDGNGYFRDVTEEKNPGLLHPGMVTDALWTDFNENGLPDLILVGEWMAVRLFVNSGTHLEELKGQEWMEHSEGWWNRIQAGDFDLDGDTDYVLGNLGKNFQIKPTPEEPATIYASDLDNNGSVDGLMCYYIQGKNAPLYSKTDLETQLLGFDKKYPDHKSFADLTISEIFPPAVLENARKFQVTRASSSYLENLGKGQFSLRDLPEEAQFSPVYSMASGDYNRDGYPDLILAGNFYGSRIKFGRLDANRGLVFLGNGDGSFVALPNHESGLYLDGEVRDMAELTLSNGSEILIFAPNNDRLQVYLKPPGTETD